MVKAKVQASPMNPKVKAKVRASPKKPKVTAMRVKMRAAETHLEKFGLRFKEQCRDFAVLSGVLDVRMLRLLGKIKCKRQVGGVYNGKGEKEDAFRSSSISWILPKKAPWLTDRFKTVVEEVGRAKWPRVVPRRWTAEPVQDAEYPAGGHYAAWHVDSSAGSLTEARELTIVAMVSPQEQFEGGELEVKVPSRGSKNGLKVQKVRLEAGEAIVFPAKKLLHRVKKVTKGHRRTLVYWAAKTSDDSHSDSDSSEE